jgi:hypothetical protein
MQFQRKRRKKSGGDEQWTSFLGKKIVKKSKCMGCLDMRGVQVFIGTEKRGHYLHQLRLEAGTSPTLLAIGS